MHRYWKARHTCPRCNFEWSSEIPQSIMHLRKVDFFWINRDQRSFEWFVNLLSQLEIEQAELGGAMERLNFICNIKIFSQFIQIHLIQL